MRYGVCIGGDREKISVAKKAGYDYVEACFSLLTTENTDEFDSYKKELELNSIGCESVNCFLPGELPVIGEKVNDDAIFKYVKTGMENGKKLGVKTVVFGSGGARRIPDGFKYEKAVKQIVHFLNDIAGPLAEENGITVVIEPLSRRDTNFINSAKEAAIIASLVNMTSIRSLVDLFHMFKSGDTNNDIIEIGDMIRHAHIAEPVNRVYPASADEFDYKGFISALETVGCKRCSLEAGCRDFAAEAKTAIDIFRSL